MYHFNSFVSAPLYHQNVPNFYMPTGNVLWNGHACNGVDAIKGVCASLPDTEHSVEVIDAQPSIGMREYATTAQKCSKKYTHPPALRARWSPYRFS